MSKNIPIIFSGPMVRALLDGRNRRFIKAFHAPDHLDVLDPSVLAHENVQYDAPLDLGVARELGILGRHLRDRNRLVFVVDELPFAREIIRGNDKAVLAGLAWGAAANSSDGHGTAEVGARA